ncbi:hypothetical protein [Celeribacter sp.]|uniref:hypothetical protein n=1 Tax=Celeribacter sp. TaxID=1890673 RepID=UPI003A93490D
MVSISFELHDHMTTEAFRFIRIVESYPLPALKMSGVFKIKSMACGFERLVLGRPFECLAEESLGVTVQLLLLTKAVFATV